MKPVPFALSMALAVSLGGPAAPAQEKQPDDKKVVKKIWFPRFSPDGSQVLAAHGGWDKKEGGEARLYSATEGKVLHVFPLPRGVRTVAWSAKGDFFVCGGYGFGVRAFDLKEKKEVFQLAGNQQIENLRITSDDKLLVVSFAAGDIRTYDLVTKKEMHRFDAVHDGGIWGMALSPNDHFVATGGKDTMVNVFDLGARKKVHSLKHPGEVNGLAFSPDNRLLATGANDSRVRIFDMKTGERVAMFRPHDGGTVNDLQFTSDGKLLVSSGTDGTIRITDISDLKNPTEKKSLKAHTGMAFGVAVSPDDARLVSVGWDEQVKMWDSKTGEPIWSWKRE